MQNITNSEKETKDLAKIVAKEFKTNIFTLTGELGAGKTTFVQGFAQGLGIKEKILSPTFVLIRQHKIPKRNKVLFHIDLYRLETLSEFENLGIKELFNNPNNLLLIEWAEKIENLLPKNITKINIEKINESQRKITILP